MRLLKEGKLEMKHKTENVTCFHCGAELEISFSDLKFHKAYEITSSPLYEYICPWCGKEGYLSKETVERLF